MAAHPNPNKLFYGDNLHVLREQIADESVDLIYLDPPFNSKRDYNLLFKTPKKPAKVSASSKPAPTANEPEPDTPYSDAQITAFEDTWHWNEVAEREFDEILKCSNTDVSELMKALRSFLKQNDMLAYLTMMCNRLLELHRVLKPTGSLYLHCDPTASHYLKLVLDGVFGKENYVNEIVWERSAPKGHTFTRYASAHDVILFYSKSYKPTWNPPYSAHRTEYIESHHGSIEPETGRHFQLDNLLNPAKIVLISLDGLLWIDVERGKTEKVIVQAKGGGHGGRGAIATLIGDVGREKAAIGLFITLIKPTREMVTEAAAAGLYESPHHGTFPKIQILTIEGLMSQRERPQFPDMSRGGQTLKQAKKENKSALGKQAKLI